MDRNYALYNALDSLGTMLASVPIFEELEDTGFLVPYNQTERLLGPLTYMATRGMRVDHARLEETKREVKTKITTAQEELNQITGRDFNYNSPKQCQQYFYIEKDIKPFTKTVKKPDGSRHQVITTDDKAMQRLATGTASRAPLREAKLIQELRGLNKLLGTYLEIEFDEDGRMRCSMNPRGTKFGRISTSKTIKGTGMNMQNLPEAFRSFLIADEDCLLIEMDKAKAEWIVVAYAARDAAMMRAIEQKLDVHAATASMMYDLPIELIIAEDEAIGHTTDADEIRRIREEKFPEILRNPRGYPRTMTLRQAGKKSNHGLNYDEAYRTFALTNELQESEAKQYIELYHLGYPGIRNNFHRDVCEQLQNSRTLTNCFGRKYRFLGRYDHDMQKAGYAFGPQSTVADLVNRALIGIYEDRKAYMMRMELMNQVHDSVILQWHGLNQVYQLAHAICECARYLNPTMKMGNREFTIDTDLKIGFSWSGMKKVKLSDDPVIMKQRLQETIHELQQVSE